MDERKKEAADAAPLPRRQSDTLLYHLSLNSDQAGDNIETQNYFVRSIVTILEGGEFV